MILKAAAVNMANVQLCGIMCGYKEKRRSLVGIKGSNFVLNL